jgi:hypothetical protein
MGSTPLADRDAVLAALDQIETATAALAQLPSTGSPHPNC